MVPLRAATILHADQARGSAFDAVCPGYRLLHCHMLPPTASGMMTRIDDT